MQELRLRKRDTRESRRPAQPAPRLNLASPPCWATRMSHARCLPFDDAVETFPIFPASPTLSSRVNGFPFETCFSPVEGPPRSITKKRRYIRQGTTALTNTSFDLSLETFHCEPKNVNEIASIHTLNFGNVSSNTLRDTVTCLRSATGGTCPHAVRTDELRSTANPGKGMCHG